MNILFFEAAMVVYLLSAIGYISYIVKPEIERVRPYPFGQPLPDSSCMCLFFISMGRIRPDTGNQFFRSR